MIKIDISNAIPRGFGTYLLALIPGMLFALTIAFGDPMIAHAMIERVKQVYPFQSYALLFLFAASCLAIGTMFHVIAWYAYSVIDFLYRTPRYLVLHTLGSEGVYRVAGWLQGTPPSRWVQPLMRIIFWARLKKLPSPQIRPVVTCQHMTAEQILIRKYGATPRKGMWSMREPDEMQVWLAVLGKAPAGFRAAFLTARAFLSCGLAELAALLIVPGLRTSYVVVLSAVILTAGFFQSVSIIRRQREPVQGSLTRLGFLMEELAETGPANSKDEKTTPSAVTINAATKATVAEDD